MPKKGNIEKDLFVEGGEQQPQARQTKRTRTIKPKQEPVEAEVSAPLPTDGIKGLHAQQDVEKHEATPSKKEENTKPIEENAKPVRKKGAVKADKAKQSKSVEDLPSTQQNIVSNEGLSNELKEAVEAEKSVLAETAKSKKSNKTAERSAQEPQADKTAQEKRKPRNKSDAPQVPQPETAAEALQEKNDTSNLDVALSLNEKAKTVKREGAKKIKTPLASEQSSKESEAVITQADNAEKEREKPNTAHAGDKKEISAENTTLYKKVQEKPAKSQKSIRTERQKSDGEGIIEQHDNKADTDSFGTENQAAFSPANSASTTESVERAEQKKPAKRKRHRRKKPASGAAAIESEIKTAEPAAPPPVQPSAQSHVAVQDEAVIPQNAADNQALGGAEAVKHKKKRRRKKKNSQNKAAANQQAANTMDLAKPSVIETANEGSAESKAVIASAQEEVIKSAELQAAVNLDAMAVQADIKDEAPKTEGAVSARLDADIEKTKKKRRNRRKKNKAQQQPEAEREGSNAGAAEHTETATSVAKVKAPDKTPRKNKDKPVAKSDKAKPESEKKESVKKERKGKVDADKNVKEDVAKKPAIKREIRFIGGIVRSNLTGFSARPFRAKKKEAVTEKPRVTTEIVTPKKLVERRVRLVPGIEKSNIAVGKALGGRFKGERVSQIPLTAVVPEAKPVIAQERTEKPKHPPLQKQAVNDAVINLFKKQNEWRRKELITAAISFLGLTAEQLADRSSGSLLTKYKSLAGSVITEMIDQKLMEVNENDFIILLASVEETKEQVNYKNEIVKLLKEKERLTRVQILDVLSGNEGVMRTNIRNLIGMALKQLEDAAEVERSPAGYYKLKAAAKYPPTPIGAHFTYAETVLEQFKKGRLSIRQYEKRLTTLYMRAINILGSEFMEYLSLYMVKTAYGMNVVKDELTAGPNDNGIDGRIELFDNMGFKETVLIQAKTKQKLTASVTVKELREFVGVMTAERATKGIMATNANVHEEAKKFLSKVPNLIVMEMELLFNLAVKYNVGIVKLDKGVPFLDAAFFIK